MSREKQTNKKHLKMFHLDWSTPAWRTYIKQLSGDSDENFFIRSNEMLMFAKLPMYICSATRVPVVCGAGQHTSHFPGHTWPHWCLPAHTWAAQCHCCWLWLPRWHGVLHWCLPGCYQVCSLLRQNSKGSVLEKNWNNLFVCHPVLQHLWPSKKVKTFSMP